MRSEMRASENTLQLGRAAQEWSAPTRSLLGRAFRVLDVCAEAERDLTLTEIARASGLPKSSAHRIVSQLVLWGGLEREGDAFRLGSHIFVLGSHAPHVRRLRERAFPFLEELYERTHEVVHLGVLDGVNVLCVDKLCGRRLPPAPIQTRVGGVMPLICTGLGKAMLAVGPPELRRDAVRKVVEAHGGPTVAEVEALDRELERVRRYGVAFDRQETHDGVVCVAAPITVGSVPPAAVSVSAPADRFKPAEFARLTLTCGRAISRALAIDLHQPAARAA